MNRQYPKQRGIGYTRAASSKRPGVKQKMFNKYRSAMRAEYNRIFVILANIEKERAIQKNIAQEREAEARKRIMGPTLSDGIDE